MKRRRICQLPKSQPCLSLGKTGFCGHCQTAQKAAASARLKAKHADPAFTKKRIAGVKKKHTEPAFKQYLSDQMRRMHIDNPRDRLPWCPEEYRAEYRQLKRYYKAAEARRMIEAQIARRSKPTPQARRESANMERTA